MNGILKHKLCNKRPIHYAILYLCFGKQFPWNSCPNVITNTNALFHTRKKNDLIVKEKIVVNKLKCCSQS